jgi:hypothetical protein
MSQYYAKMNTFMEVIERHVLRTCKHVACEVGYSVKSVNTFFLISSVRSMVSVNSDILLTFLDWQNGFTIRYFSTISSVTNIGNPWQFIDQ